MFLSTADPFDKINEDLDLNVFEYVNGIKTFLD